MTKLKDLKLDDEVGGTPAVSDVSTDTPNL